MKPWLMGALGVLVIGAASALAQQTSPPQMPSLVRGAASDLPRIYAVRASVADLARSERFYRDGLGARQVVHLQPTEIMVQFASGLNVMVSQRPAAGGSAAPTDGAGGFVLEVPDIEAAVARAAAAGGRVVRPASSGASSLGVRTAFIRDPDGVGIELVELPQR